MKPGMASLTTGAGAFCAATSDSCHVAARARPSQSQKRRRIRCIGAREQLGLWRQRTSCSVRCTTSCLFATQRPSVSRVAAISASFCAMSPSRRLRGEFVRAGDSE